MIGALKGYNIDSFKSVLATKNSVLCLNVFHLRQLGFAFRTISFCVNTEMQVVIKIMETQQRSNSEGFWWFGNGVDTFSPAWCGCTHTLRKRGQCQFLPNGTDRSLMLRHIFSAELWSLKTTTRPSIDHEKSPKA